jgi:hypothetical protein
VYVCGIITFYEVSDFKIFKLQVNKLFYINFSGTSWFLL